MARRGRFALAATFLLALLTPLARHTPSSAGVPPTTNQRLGVLASFFPSERDFPGSNHPMWDRLASVGTDAGLVATVELTSSSVDYMDFVAREKRVGQTTLMTLNANVDYLMLDSASFQKSTYGFDGVLLRGYSGACDGTQPTAGLVSSLRSLGLAPIVIATSGQPESCFGALADVLLNYEGSFSSYGSVGVPSWLVGSTPKLWHVLYDVPESQIATAVAATRVRGADYVMTSPNSGPVEASTIPPLSYWSTLRSAVRNAAPAPTVDERWPIVTKQRSAIPAFGTAYPNWPMIHALPVDPYATVIVNASNGPGSTINTALSNEIHAAQADHRLVLGYITAGYLPSSARTVQQVVDDAVRFRSFYGVDGFFIDEVRPECTSASSYQALANAIRAAAPGPIVLNPGRNVGECLVNAFDAIVDFEGPMSSYRTWLPSAWTGKYPATRFWQLVHTTQPSEIAEAVHLSQNRQAGRIYVTTLAGPVQWTAPLNGTDLSALTTVLSERPVAPGGSIGSAPPRTTPAPAPTGPPPQPPAPGRRAAPSAAVT